ncbi:hypothetical protein ACROYT_G014639 [Oculina patagonica]
MEKDDHTDLCKMFEDVGDHVPESMTSLWEQQQNLLRGKSKNAYRWHSKIMRLCLDLYCKNPNVLVPLRQFIILPSNKTIRMYKNKVKETPGWNEEVLMWCMNAAKENGLKPGDFMGGFAIDEMKIQENLGMTSVNGKHKLLGFVDLGIGHDIMRTLSDSLSEFLARIWHPENGKQRPLTKEDWTSSSVLAPLQEMKLKNLMSQQQSGLAKVNVNLRVQFRMRHTHLISKPVNKEVAMTT